MLTTLLTITDDKAFCHSRFVFLFVLDSYDYSGKTALEKKCHLAFQDGQVTFILAWPMGKGPGRSFGN